MTTFVDSIEDKEGVMLAEQFKTLTIDEEARVNRMELFKELGNYNAITNTTRIVDSNEFVGKYKVLRTRNGGDWNRKSACKTYKVAVMHKNGNVKFRWKPDNEVEKDSVIQEFKSFISRESGVVDNRKKSNGIKYIKIFGLKEADSGHPIRQDIRDYYIKQPCCVCGSSTELQCDHKNDLYNDPRVLSVKTQNRDDFQSLCTHCNDRKRQIMTRTKETCIRFPATDIPSLKPLGIKYIYGDETYDITDINAMVGTYWYDPVKFMSVVAEKMKNPTN